VRELKRKRGGEKREREWVRGKRDAENERGFECEEKESVASKDTL